MDISSTISEYLHKLCSSLTTDTDGAYELAISYLSSTGEKSLNIPDEKLLCQKIQTQLSIVSPAEADKFNECYQKIKNSFILKHRTAVLSLLLSLSESCPQSDTMQLFPVPQLAIAKPSDSALGGTSGSSKTTIGSGSWGKQPSNQSLPSDKSHMALAIRASDQSNERQCVRDAVLAATGIKTRGGVSASRPLHILYSRIAHLGFLHDRLKEFIDPNAGLMPQGLMGEGLVAAIRDELTEYHRSIALLQSQTCDNDGGVTLRRLCVWAQEPLHRLTWLANIVHAAQHKKGGELASCVHRFVRHGDERVATFARRLLTSLTYPLLLMLTRWLMHGEIDDPFNEFFIESRSGVPIDRMWHDKYRVREWMVPSFMTRELAGQILATGKSVVFMREACADEPTHDTHAQHLTELLKPSSEEGGAWWEASGLSGAVAAAHGAAAARLTAALGARHHVLDHLAAHRRYLLLAQGDFHHHLMTLLQDELNKPVSSLYVHNLTCTLEAAVRATNAQFEPPHVLARLHVNLYPNCESRDSRATEETGWDVFALQYRVDGPLGTLFPATLAARYRSLFTHLWRVKRIEYALHDAWRQHAILNKRLKYMPEVCGLLRRVSCVRLEALRMCGALQEAGFVGAAPAWQELLAAAARCPLDRLLHLHRRALERQCIDAMIHHTTQELQSYLGNVLNETLALRSFETMLHNGIHAELDRRDQIEQLKAERFARGEYAFTNAEEAQDKEKRKIFHQFLAGRKADLNVWTRTYRAHVSTLILKLALHQEVSLQTLAFRLDYNDFYKRSDAKLHEPLTYQHKRLSEIGLGLNKHKGVTRRNDPTAFENVNDCLKPRSKKLLIN